MQLRTNLNPNYNLYTAQPQRREQAQVSFARRLSYADIFKHEIKTCEENIKMDVVDPYNVTFAGDLNHKDYNITFSSSEDYKKRKYASIKGHYDGKAVDIKGFYKNKNTFDFKGKFGEKDFAITLKLDRLFSHDKMQGGIDGEPFSAKFPSASCKDENTDLMILLLHLAGYTPSFDGCNFDVVDSSLARYGYFSGTIESNDRPLWTIMDELWHDPVSVPCV